MSRSRFVAAVTMASIMAGLLGASPVAGRSIGSANGDSGGWVGDVPDGMAYDPVANSVRGDITEMVAASIADETGARYERVLAQLRRQEANDGVFAKLEAQFPGQFAGMYWDAAGRPVAQFKGVVPQAARELIAAGGADGRSETVRFSTSELGQQRDDLITHLREQGYADYVVAIDVRSNRVLATVGTRGVPAGAARLAMATGAAPSLPTRFAGTGVTVDVVDGPVLASYGNVLGGGAMGTSSAFACTSGFSVTYGSTIGISTAGHCGTGMTAYKDIFRPASYALTYRNGMVGFYGDFEWFTTTGTPVDDFYHNGSGAIYDVSGIKNTFAIGDTIQAFGLGTAKEATGHVAYLNVSAGGRGNLACVSENIMSYGDSGGPVYVGGTAAGLVMGGVRLGGSVRFCFSQARYIDDAIGVSIKTT